MPVAFMTRTTFFRDSGIASYCKNNVKIQKKSTISVEKSVLVDPLCPYPSCDLADLVFVSRVDGCLLEIDYLGLRSA